MNNKTSKFSDYARMELNFSGIEIKRKEALRKIREYRKRPTVVYASIVNCIPTDYFAYDCAINYEDLVCLQSEISTIDEAEKKVDLLIETPGGAAEVVQDIVSVLRNRFDEVGIIIPGWAKSAGTMLAMSADEILMEPQLSSLGPIDAQIFSKGSWLPVDAILEEFEEIKEHVMATGQLNPAYLALLSGHQVGDFKQAQNIKAFTTKIVTEWLIKYQLKNWNNGSKDSKTEKNEKAEKIATKLNNHRHWLTHNYCIKLQDLQEIDKDLKITDYSCNKNLFDAIKDYYLWLRIAFQKRFYYKIIETEFSQLYKLANVQQVLKPPVEPQTDFTVIEVLCVHCKKINRLQVNFRQNITLRQDCHFLFPPDNILCCNECKQKQDISRIREQLEVQFGKEIV